MLISGRMLGKARANNVLPDPGEPAISMLWTKDRTLFNSSHGTYQRLKTIFSRNKLWASVRRPPKELPVPT
jgi:hypothetical protein